MKKHDVCLFWTVQTTVSFSLDIREKNRNSYLEVKCFITVEDKYKATQLVAKCFHGLCLTSSSRSYITKQHGWSKILTINAAR